MKYIYTYIIFIILCSNLYGQTNNLIQGRIFDYNSKTPIDFANIILLSNDSVFISGTVSDENGYFRIKNISNNEFILKVSFLGYDTYIQRVALQPGINNLEDIQLILSSTMLDGVTITSKEVPFKSSNNGGIVANVSTTLLSSVGTANDVIQRMPGITINDDKISVFNKGNPIIYINNRRLNDNRELEKVESSNITNIELITNPGAKYDASGRSVLVINTKKKQNGFSSQITERTKLGYYWGDNENLNLSYSTNKLNLFASYYHLYGKTKVKEKEDIFVMSDNIWQHNINSPYKYTNNTQQASLGFDWNIDSIHTVGGQYQYHFQKLKSHANFEGNSFINENLYDKYNANSFIDANPYKHLLNLYYKGLYSSKYSIEVDFDYMKNHDRRDQQTQESSTIGNRIVDITSRSNYNLYAARLTNNYKSFVGLIEFGGEYNQITGNGFTLNPEGYTPNNIYTTKEQKAAAFISYSKTINNFNISAGLRYEYTHEKSTADSTKIVRTNQEYHVLYPSLSISKKIRNVDFSLNFTKRVQRPSFPDLSGNTVYLNKFVMQTGNPFLKKTDIYDINIQSNFKMFYLNLGYTYEKNPYTFENKQQDNSETILLSMINYPRYQEINGTLNFSHTIESWQPNYSIEIRKPFFSVDYLDKKKTYNNTDFSFKAYNDFTLPYNITLSLNFTYQSNYSYYLMEMKHYEKLDAGVRKSFFNNHLKFNLEIRDVFNWVKEENIMRVNNIYLDQYRKGETQYGQFTVTYLFNNFKRRNRSSSAAENDMNRF